MRLASMGMRPGHETSQYGYEAHTNSCSWTLSVPAQLTVVIILTFIVHMVYWCETSFAAKGDRHNMVESTVFVN